ncbi:unnamed protein product [Closterium sp. NIES-65]|nr:unnamed protein product [Closterium sp. NIES-65]
MAATRTGVYVDDFLTEVSSLPHELQRMLSLMRELDGRCQALRMEIQRDIRAGLTAIEEREAVLRAGAGAQDGHGHEGLDGHADAGGDRDGNGDGDGQWGGEGDEDDAASDSDAAEDAGNGDNESDGAVVTPAALSPATGALDEVPGGEQAGAKAEEGKRGMWDDAAGEHLRSLNQELQHFSEDLKQAASPAAGVGGARGWGEPKGEGRGLSAVAVLASGSGGEGGGGGGGGVWEAKGEAWQGNQERESERGAGREAGRETGREAGREAGRDAGREREWERGGRGAALMPPPAAPPALEKEGRGEQGRAGGGRWREEGGARGGGRRAGCEGGEWFHYECVGLSIAMPRIHDKWFCPHCTSLHKKGMLHLPP